VWIIANEGLFEYLDGKWVKHNIQVFPIVFDKQNNLWGYENNGKGLGKFDGTNWTWFTNEIPCVNVKTIVIDKFNNKWIGTDGQGLGVFNENGLQFFDNSNQKSKTQHILSQISLKVKPNPIAYKGIISYYIPLKSKVRIDLYNILGQNIKELESGTKEKGEYNMVINTFSFSQGIYFIKLSANNRCAIVKLIIDR